MLGREWQATTQTKTTEAFATQLQHVWWFSFADTTIGWRISWRSRWSNISWENRPEIRGRPTPLKTLSDLVSCFQIQQNLRRKKFEQLRSSMAAVRFEDATQRQAQAQAPARGRFLGLLQTNFTFLSSQLFPACANLGKPRPEFSDGGIVLGALSYSPIAADALQWILVPFVCPEPCQPRQAKVLDELREARWIGW